MFIAKMAYNLIEGLWSRCLSSVCCVPADPRHAKELDQAVVCAEAGRAAHLQEPQHGALGGHGAAQLLQAH